MTEHESEEDDWGDAFLESALMSDQHGTGSDEDDWAMACRREQCERPTPPASPIESEEDFCAGQLALHAQDCNANLTIVACEAPVQLPAEPTPVGRVLFQPASNRRSPEASSLSG